MSGKALCELPSLGRGVPSSPPGEAGSSWRPAGCCLSRTHPVAVLLLRGRLGAPKAPQHTEGLLLYRERLFL